MSFHVHWNIRAENELADIWMQASDRSAVTEAASRLDEALRLAPLRTGESRESEQRRIAVELPLAILFTVVPNDSLVVITKVRLLNRV